MIYNPKPSYSILPNRKKPGEPKQLTNHDPWNFVSRKITSSVKIKILFLAGLLDVVTKLQEQFKEIELPQ